VNVIHAAVVLGLAGVVPLALRESVARWAAAAAAVAVSFLLPSGPVAALLVVPAAAAAAHLGWRAARTVEPLILWRLHDVVRLFATGYTLVAVGALLVSRAGLTPMGQREPIIELTTVHYLYAGVAALVLAGATGRAAAVALTAVAPPIVAIGFLTGAALPQVGGAVLMTLGVWITGTLELRAALASDLPPVARVLLAVSGVAIWVPMVVAVAWAAGQHWSIPILSIPDMARTHGVANAIGFVACGLLAERVRAPRAVAA
jgi:hypothetical protein